MPFSRLSAPCRCTFTGLLLSLWLPVVAVAADIPVANNNDLIRDGDGCSLREAVINANANDQSGSRECAAGTPGLDTIYLPAGTITFGGNLSAEEADPTRGDLDVTDTLAVVGRGARSTVLDAEYRHRHFDVAAGTSFTLSHVALYRGEVADAYGGAIRVGPAGTLDVEDARLLEGMAIHVAAEHGGAAIGAHTGAIVNVRRVELTNNRGTNALSQGGAIWCDGCDLRLENSTVSGSRAGLGAAIFARDAAVSMQFVTVAGSVSVYARTAVELVNSSLQLTGSVVADNLSGGWPDLGCDASSTVAGTHSVVERQSGCSAWPAGVLRRDTDFPAATAALLMPLQFVGGSAASRVHPISFAFEALLRDAIPLLMLDCANRVDQLGNDRPVGGSCDMGALEQPIAVIEAAADRIDELSGSPLAMQVRLLSPRLQALRVALAVDATPGTGGCTLDTTNVVIPAGSTVAAFGMTPVDDLVADVAPAFVHECVVRGTVTGDEALLVGESVSAVRVDVVDDDSLVPVFSSVPAPGDVLDLGVVAVGGRGEVAVEVQEFGRQMLTVAVDPAGTFSGPQASEFYVDRLPLSLPDSTGQRGSFRVGCAPRDKGVRTATLHLVTNDPQYQSVSYPVTCRGAYVLVARPDNGVMEGQGSNVLPVRLVLSSAAVSTIARFRVYSDGSGTAVAGEDFVAFDDVVEFAPGVDVIEYNIRLVDDDQVEADETIGIGLAPLLADTAVAAASVSGMLLDDESRKSDLQLIMTGVPSVMDESTFFTATLTLTNAGPLPVEDWEVRSLERYGVVFRRLESGSAQCSISGNGRGVSCRGGRLEVGDSISLPLRLLAAEVIDPGVLRYADGEVGFVAAAEGVPELLSADNTVLAGFRLNDVSEPAGGGGAWSPWWLLALILGGLRRRG